MCGIAGLFLKNPNREHELGGLLAGMLEVLRARGPDSTGFAIFGDDVPGNVKLTLRVTEGVALDTLVGAVAEAIGGEVRSIEVRADHAVFCLPAAHEATALAALATFAPAVSVVSAGQRIELYKGVGLPAEVSARFKLPQRGGSHAIGHTRMATESAITVAGAHPFSTGADQCLVHNGSLSNHNTVRRALRREGLEFETENDSEVAAGYLSWRMREGAQLDEALTAALSDLDGFYTFVVGTRTGFGVLRDPIACKPAVMAETDDYVAFGSEYRALAVLPGIERARLFEPEAGRVYVWERSA